MVTFSCSNEDSDDFCFYSTRKNKCTRVTREGTSEDHTKAFQPRSINSKGRTVKETPDYDFPQWLTWNRAWDTLKRNNFANHVVRCGHFKSAIARVFDKRSLNFFKHLFTALAYKIRNCSASLSFQFKRCF